MKRLNIKEKNECYMGVDLNPGSSPLKPPALYSIAILCDDKLVYKNPEGKIEAIVRLAWEYKPKLIAIDNPFELSRNIKGLNKLVNMLPEHTNIVWINKSSGEMIKIKELLKKEGLDENIKFSPIKTAVFLAYMARNSQGVQLIRREEATKIIVRKQRNPKKGGMSSNRYKRKIRTNMLRATKTLKKILDSNKIDYDLLYKKSGGGLEGAVFTVYVSKNKIERLIKEIDGSDVRIELKPIFKIDLGETITKATKPIIVGIDPGLTTGISILDLNGKPLHVSSRRGTDRTEIIDLIKNYGRPIIVATDVTPIPETVKKLASLWKARIFQPAKNIPVEEKREIASHLSLESGIKIHDNHSRDALVAAYLAYKDYHDKMRQLESYVNRMGIDIPLEDVKKHVLQGKTIVEAVEKTISKMLEDIPYIKFEEKKKQYEEKTKSEKLEQKIEQLKWERQNLLTQLRKANEKIEALERKLDKILLQERSKDYNDIQLEQLKSSLRDISLRLRESNEKIYELEKKIQKYKLLLYSLANNEVLILPKLYGLTKSNVNKLGSTKEGVVFVENIDLYQREAVKLLRDKGYSFVIYKGKESRHGCTPLLKEHDILPTSLDEIGKKAIIEEKYVIIEKNVIEDLKKKLAKMLKEKEELERKKILEALKEYRESRIKYLENAWKD